MGAEVAKPRVAAKPTVVKPIYCILTRTVRFAPFARSLSNHSWSVRSAGRLLSAVPEVLVLEVVFRLDFRLFPTPSLFFSPWLSLSDMTPTLLPAQR